MELYSTVRSIPQVAEVPDISGHAAPKGRTNLEAPFDRLKAAECHLRIPSHRKPSALTPLPDLLLYSMKDTG